MYYPVCGMMHIKEPTDDACLYLWTLLELQRMQISHVLPPETDAFLLFKYFTLSTQKPPYIKVSLYAECACMTLKEP